MTTALEDAYREAWIKQNQIDKTVNKRVKPDPLFRDPKKAKLSGKAGGLLGGRPKKVKNDK